MKDKLIMDAHDVHAFTRYSMGHCRRIIRKIKECNAKQKHQKVTVDEVSEYFGINPEQVLSFFRPTG
ncbi:MAG: hypothetical protein ACXWVV_05125 [Kaistella sp.]